MAASPSADVAALPAQDKWISGEGNDGPIGDIDRRESGNVANGDSAAAADSNDDYHSEQSVAKSGATFREKQVKVPSSLVFMLFSVQSSMCASCFARRALDGCSCLSLKLHVAGAYNTAFMTRYLWSYFWYLHSHLQPNKVYIGGLPEHTRQEDLQSCFGKIGSIVNIELKLGYGFVEFDTREAAEESVAKYHEGYFMGNKIRVELSHGGGRTAKYTGDPGACFKCGMLGHWARECPNHSIPGAGQRRVSHFQDPAPRDYPPPPPRDYPYREEFSRYPPARDPRFGYDYPPPPPRDFRRPVSPPRDYRDYPAVPRPPRDYDDYRMRPPPAPPARPYYPADVSYPPRGYDAPPRDIDRASRAAAPPSERYAAYSTSVARPRTPPGPPPARVRDDFDRVSSRDYPPTDYRGRATTPPMPPPSTSAAARYGEYPPRTSGSEQSIQRYRRRSQSPPPRSGGSGYRSGSYANNDHHGSDAAPYPPASAPYSATATTYSGNGYTASSSGAPPRSGGSARDRDYSSRNGTEPTGYSRRA
ncbi:hypothetical protein EW145_g437 [Phellinidium pouzarii]|uniref:RNA-binding domain-containing protein n=1 Tax=Phellinidium pouzarii TaxID=167371 RepID=A0A4S4LK60_9AGAM|nr:hypothetical protein EW145_g437 [Phellinidium pouzarii]